MKLRYASVASCALIAMLAGIGAVAPATAFGVYHALILQPLGIPAPEHVLLINGLPLPPPVVDPVAYYERSGIFTALTHYTPASVDAGSGSRAMQLTVAQISGDFFALAGLTPQTPLHGSAAAKVYLSHQLSQRLAGSAGGAVPQLRLNGTEFPVAGVMPPGFSFPQNPDVWLLSPSTPFGSLVGGLRNQGSGLLGDSVWLGRLKAGLSLSLARSRIAQLAAQEQRQFPPSGSGNHRLAPRISAIPITSRYVTYARPPLEILAFASILLLLICATGMIALGATHASARKAAAAIRQALGATRSRAALAEVAPLLSSAVVGAVLALVLSAYALRLAAAALARPGMPARTFAPGPPAWAAAALIALGLCCLSAAPFFRQRRSDTLASILARRAPGSSSSGAAIASIIFAETAVVTLLLCATLAAGLGLFAAVQVRLNYNPNDVTSIGVALARRIPSPSLDAANARAEAVVAHALSSLEAAPGTLAAAATTCLPLDCSMPYSVWIQKPAWEGTFARVIFVSPDYFAALDQPLLRGAWGSVAGNQVAVSASLANLLSHHGSGNIIGSVFTAQQHGNHTLRVAAVVANVRLDTYADKSMPVLYLPISRPLPMPIRGFSLVIRRHRTTSLRLPNRWGSAISLAPATPLAAIVDRSLLPAQLRWKWLELAAAAAGFLTWAGVFGLISASVRQRRTGFAVRSALGAAPWQIARHVLAPPLRWATAGAGVGVLTWVLFAPLGERALALGTLPASAMSLPPVIAVLGVIAAAAGPALRAARGNAADLLRD